MPSPRRSPPFVTIAIALVCVAMFALQWVWGQGNVGLSGRRMGALIPSRLLAGEWWRLWSLSVLHVSVLHLAQNMLGLIALGSFLERVLGHWRFIVLFTLSVAGGAIASATRPDDPFCFGASGGNWGLIVAYAMVVTFPLGEISADEALTLRRNAWVLVGVLGAYSLLPNVDWRAHLGGGLVGVVFVTLRRAEGERGGVEARFGWQIRMLSITLSALWLGSIGAALKADAPWALIERWSLEPTEVGGLRLAMPRELKSTHTVRKNGTQQWGLIGATGAEIFLISSVGTDLIDRQRADTGPAFRFVRGPELQRLVSGLDVAFSESVPANENDERFVLQWSWREGEGQISTLMINSINTATDERRATFESIAESVQVLPR